MKDPYGALTHNLAFGRKGTVWATWRLTPRPYGMKPVKEKRAVRAMHTAMYRAVPGEMLLMGLTSPIGANSVVSSTIEGVDLVAHPGVIDEAEANLDRLDGLSMGQRFFYLSVPLPNSGLDLFMEPARAAWDELQGMLAMPRLAPSDARVAKRLRQAEAIRRALPLAFMAEPVSVWEHLWIRNHACIRGVLDREMTRSWGSSESDESVVRMGSLPAPTLDVAGQTDELDAGEKLNPLKRRYLKVISSEIPSWQAMLTVAATPPEGVAFPGGEWVANLDNTGVRVDFAQRVVTHSSAEVTRRNIKAMRNLEEQVDQRSIDAAAYAGSGGLEGRIAQLTEYVALLEADKNEIETESTTILSVGGASREELEDNVNIVQQVMGPEGWGFTLSREPGAAQETLWWAGQPGARLDPVTKALAQITTSHSLAAAVPVTTTELGDYSGALIGLGIHGGVPSPVLMDLEDAARSLNVSPSMGVVGELGSGKSVLLKTIVLLCVDRGSRAVAIDRSETGEWVRALSSVEGLRVVDISANAQVSLDPLRVLPKDAAGRYAQNFLQALLGIAATSDEAALIGDVVEDDYRAKHKLTSLSEVAKHLGTLEDPLAQPLARRLRNFARKPLTRVMFDDSLPAMTLEDPAVVFRTHELDLPTSSELENAHLYQNMSVDKVFSRAVYAQLVAIGRMMAFRRRDRLDLFVADEAHAVTLSAESTRDLEYLVRDGRKHMAGLMIGSHDPEQDFGDSETLRHLISWRFVMRHRDPDLAARALDWLGLDSTDQDLLDKVTMDLSPIPEGADSPDPARLGEGLVRDARNRYGLIKVLAPASGTRYADVMSTPMAEEAH